MSAATAATDKISYHGEDWVDVTAGREDPRAALFKGKIRPSGKLKTLWRMRKVFPS